MSEVLRDLDLLVMQAVLVEEMLRLEIAQLQRQRRKVGALLEEKTLSPEQRQILERLMDFINDRNLKLYGD